MIRKVLSILAALALACTAAHARAKPVSDLDRWKAQARNVVITRDDWGIAHIHGKTDADAVFGMLYAQAEDDFPRIELNYINGSGRLAEVEGEAKVWQDLRQKIFTDPADMKAKFAASPPWLKALMTSFADGLNYYLYRHPEVHPRLIRHFEPWMALTFPEGSIGGDVERIKSEDLKAFYGGDVKGPVLAPARPPLSVEDGAAEEGGVPETGPFTEPTGSNGIAIAPSNTVDHHALLLINPHTSFYFRSELQVSSEQGLNAYGAVTWGQFFVYQGFNDRIGWMHTSSGVDAVDEYLETVRRTGNHYEYKYGSGWRPIIESRITVPYKTALGMSSRTFTVYRNHHGPVIRAANGKWVTIRLMQRPMASLIQSYVRTRARDYKGFRATMEYKANSTNNTIFADADGDIAYFHGNFIPRRDDRFDWKHPVDGSDPHTEWQGLLNVDETPHLLNPASGWLYNSNNWPWTAAGASSPKRSDYPRYVENGGESARGVHAVRLLQTRRDFTLNGLIAAAYDQALPWFDRPIPALVRAWDARPAGDVLKAKTAEQIAMLRSWDRRWGVNSIATSLAVFWGDDLRQRLNADAKKAGMTIEDYIDYRATPAQLLYSLSLATERLKSDFGTWKTPWGEINRFQRLNDDTPQPYNDKAASVPVGFTSAVWGSLASFGAHSYPGTKKWYGSSGNSFVAVVEFGPKIRAKAITAGGESGDPASPHFADQASRYATGALRDVYFYPSDLKGHIERVYHPGD
jgi:acyl-homoserine lactone acylase PvdQ